MNTDLINEIKDEINICEVEMRRADIDMVRLQERRNNYSDRKVMLDEILKKAEQLLEKIGEING